MNPIIITCFNNLEMTKRAVESALAQDVPDLQVSIMNNGSTDGTLEWLNQLADHVSNIKVVHFPENHSPTRLANRFLREAFNDMRVRHVLGIPNDVILPKNLYSEMLRFPRGIVTASETKTLPPPHTEKAVAVNECTPFAVTLIRKWMYEAIVAQDGHFFDEQFFHYASDCDMALRMVACGIRGLQLDIQYYHFGSASLKTLCVDKQADAHRQADEDREYFRRKWGFKVDSLEYGQSPNDLNFAAGSR